jgi:hypothetical protein
MELNVKTVSELRKIAKEVGISYTGLSKAQLIHYLAAPKCKDPRKSCSDLRICDIFNNRCVENKFLKPNLMIETIDDIQYAGLKKDFSKWYQILEKLNKEEKVSEIIIEPAVEKIKEETPKISKYISRDEMDIRDIKYQINLFDKYNKTVNYIINI